MATWTIYRWAHPTNQNGRLMLETPDEHRARAEFHNLAVNMRQGAVRLYEDGRCVEASTADAVSTRW